MENVYEVCETHSYFFSVVLFKYVVFSLSSSSIVFLPKERTLNLLKKLYVL